MSRVSLTINAGNAPERAEAFDINGPNGGFVIASERIADWNVGAIPDRLLDLLDIAAAVYAADRLVTRGVGTRPGFGNGWRRDLAFEIAVREPGFWNHASVREALTEAVRFLTDDSVTFAFTQSERAPAQDSYLPFAPADHSEGGQRHGEDVHVVLFSGGLDSLAGALEVLEQERGRVILVTHLSAPKIIARQNALAERLRQRYGERVAYVPVEATFRNRKFRESSSRSRSFLFAALGYVIARTAGTDRAHFFENGIVSQNLPLSPMIIGTMATRTTHVAALQRIEAFLRLIDGQRFMIRNRFEWLTKAEVVGKLQTFRAADWIPETVSCNEVWNRSTEHSHCGACTQCLDRRFGIVAAGLAQHEPEDIYETPVLTGERVRLRSKTMALQWTLHALRLGSMDMEAFRERFGGDVARLARGLPDLEPSEVLRRSFELHRRHGFNIQSVLERILAARPGALLDGSLPETSLLRLVVAERTGTPALAEVTAREQDWMVEAPSSDWAGDDDDDIDGRLLVSMTGTGSGQLLTVRGLGSVKGPPAGPAFALRPQFEADQTKGLDPDDHEYVSAGLLTPEGGPSKQAVAQNVKRCRSKLADCYKRIHGVCPPSPLVIQNRQNRGYRLDPLIRLVKPGGDSDPA